MEEKKEKKEVKCPSGLVFAGMCTSAINMYFFTKPVIFFCLGKSKTCVKEK